MAAERLSMRQIREILRQKIPKDDMIIPIVASIYAHMEDLSYYDLYPSLVLFPFSQCISFILKREGDERLYRP